MSKYVFLTFIGFSLFCGVTTWVVNSVPLDRLLGMQLTFHKLNKRCVFSGSISDTIIITKTEQNI